MFTLLAIEREKISNKSQYVAVKNETYVQLADKLGIRHAHYSSPNNTGNVMESLCWLAYEQNRYDFILSIVKFAVDLEYPDAVAADFEYPDAVASGPAVAVASSPAKTRRRQTSVPPTSQACSQSSDTASWRWQATSQRDADFQYPDTVTSGRAVQDGEPSEDERVCMSSWARATFKEYVRLNEHATGRQEEMEHQAAWFELQVQKENAKRQERSNKGQTLEVLQRTTTVPDTDLPTYLRAYLSFCGTPPRIFKRRLDDLAKRFSLPRDQLRTVMAISVAEPKKRSDDEVDEAFKRFKLTYKEECLQHFRKQEPGPRKKFIRDIFGGNDAFMEYLRSGHLTP